jgi:hypothetical protein
MILRLLDSLLPTVVLVALALALASAFGALSTPPVARVTTPVVTLERVVITAERAPRALAHAEAARTTTER